MAYNFAINHVVQARSLTASFNGPPIECMNQDNIGLQLNWTGAPVGTFGAQVSNDHAQDAQGNVTVAGNWISLPLNPMIAASGSPDSAYIDLNQLGAAYVRVTYTATSGTGTVDCFVTEKAV